MNIEALKYPTGKFVKGRSYSMADIKNNITSFKQFPNELKAVAGSWEGKLLDVIYREGGWNGRQVIHHLADSHGNLPLRVKTCLTEINPQIKPYDEGRWAQLYDANHSDIKLSVMMLEGIHARLGDLFDHLSESDWQKTIYHPESNHTFTLAELLALYAWHGPHHLGHLKLVEQNFKSGAVR